MTPTDPESKRSREFYDELAPRQLAASFNARQLGLLDRLEALGLQPDSKVVEIGCGIGIISSMILDRIPRGRLFASDLSPQSIEIARQINREAPPSTFAVASAPELPAPDFVADFVLLLDVLEHIPIGLHRDTFEAVEACCSKDTRVVVNIPSPRYLQHLHAHHPELLQELDQPLETSELLANAAAGGLRLDSAETWGLENEDEYQFFVLRPQADWSAVPVRRGPWVRRAVAWWRRRTLWKRYHRNHG